MQRRRAARRFMVDRCCLSLIDSTYSSFGWWDTKKVGAHCPYASRPSEELLLSCGEVGALERDDRPVLHGLLADDG